MSMPRSIQYLLQGSSSIRSTFIAILFALRGHTQTALEYAAPVPLVPISHSQVKTFVTRVLQAATARKELLRLYNVKREHILAHREARLRVIVPLARLVIIVPPVPQPPLHAAVGHFKMRRGRVPASSVHVTTV